MKLQLRHQNKKWAWGRAYNNQKETQQGCEKEIHEMLILLRGP